jgi:hypothetical protein
MYVSTNKKTEPVSDNKRSVIAEWLMFRKKRTTSGTHQDKKKEEKRKRCRQPISATE